MLTLHSEKCADVTQYRDELHHRMFNLLELTAMARKLKHNDVKLIRLSQRFVDNFSSALDVEPDDLDQLENDSHLRLAIQ